MAHKIVLRPTIIESPNARMRAKIVTFKDSNPSVKPTFTLVSTSKDADGYVYTYQIKNDATAAEAINKIILWPAAEGPLIHFDRDGVQPGQTKQFVIKSALAPGKVRASVLHIDPIKEARVLETMGNEFPAEAEEAFPSFVILMVDGPAVPAKQE